MSDHEKGLSKNESFCHTVKIPAVGIHEASKTWIKYSFFGL